MELDRVRVKGKDTPVAIFEPLGRRGEVDRSLLDPLSLFQRALEHLRSQNWDMAEVQLLNLHKRFPERRLYSLYLERIEAFRIAPPPPGWDGVCTFTTK
jgi:adenylate cyclase